MLSLRSCLVALIVLATVGFVVGTRIERHDEHHEPAAQIKVESGSGEGTAAHEEGERAAGDEHHAQSGAESSTPTEEGHGEASKELRPLGVNIEATPFVILAALVSLALAGLGWTRPRWLQGLALIAAAVLLFGALDIREVFHQSDENRTGLAILAATVAALHLAAFGLAALMAARRDSATADAAV